MTLLEAQQLRVSFPAHPNTTLGAIAVQDVTYLDFLASQTWLDWQLREAVDLLCAHHGRRPKRPAGPGNDRRQGELF